MIQTKTFTVAYQYFEPGTFVVPTSPRCPLDAKDGPFEVLSCDPPMEPEDTCVMQLRGQRYGISTTYFREAMEEEEQPTVFWSIT